MAEEDYVSYDKYRADLADFRADLARFREEVRGELAAIRTELGSTKGDLRTEMYRLHAQTIIWLASVVATGVALTVTLVKVIP
jgi:hypothetical protein